MAVFCTESRETTMTKQEYLAQLEQRLSAYPADYQQDMLDAFEGHFQEGHLQGRSEEEIMKDLGSIDDVMANIDILYDGPKQKPSSPSEQDLHRDCNELDDSLSKTDRSPADDIRQNAGQEDHDSFQTNNEEVVSIAEGAQYQVLLIKGTDGNVDVELMPSEHLAYQFIPRNSIFSQKSAHLTTASTGNGLSFVVKGGSARLNLYVPENIRSIEAELGTGDLEASGMDLERLNINEGTGEVELDRISLKDIYVKTVSGEITMKDCQCWDAELHTISGDLTMHNNTGHFYAKTISGDIDASQYDKGPVRLETVSGDISLETSADTIEASSKSGDIEISQEGEINTVQVSSISGDVDTEFESQDYTAQLYTKTGDKENGTRMSTILEADSSWTIGQGKGKISLRSKTGDVTIR